MHRKERPILEGDHDAMTETQKRSHYNAGCGHPECRAAKAAYQRELASRRATESDDAEAKAKKNDERLAIAHETAEELQADAPVRPAPMPTPASFMTSEGRGGPVTVTTEARGASRRLQGLVAQGHTPKAIAAEVGLPVDAIWWLLIAPPAQIQMTNHRRIADVFKILRVSPPNTTDDTPSARHANRAQALAEQLGWAGPFDWDYIDTDASTKVNISFGDPERLAEAIAAARIELAEDAPSQMPGVQDMAQLVQESEAAAIAARQDYEAERQLTRELQQKNRELEIVLAKAQSQNELIAADNKLLTESLAATKRELEFVEKSAAQTSVVEHFLGDPVDQTTIVVENGRITITAPTPIAETQ